MTTQELTTTAGSVLVGVPMMDATEARQIVSNINRHFDAARRELLELHDREGWRALGYSSWRDCAQAEFGQSAAYLYRQLAAAKIELVLDSPIGEIPESHLRPLTQLDTPAQQRRAYQAATANGPATAKKVQQAVAEVTAPELPIEFAIIQRRLAARDHVLSPAWDGATQRYVVRREGGTGVVMLWPAVLEKLERLEAEPEAPATETQIKVAAPASDRVAYEANERADQDILSEAIATLAGVRGLLSTVKVATWQRDKTLRQITPAEAKAFLLYQKDRLTRFSDAAMISQATFTQALDHIQALLDCVVTR